MSAGAAFCLAYGSVSLACAPITAMKGKWGSLVLGLLIPLAWIVAASRLAKPNSYSARRFYDDRKLLRAETRHNLAI